MYAIADKYDIVSLKDYALVSFELEVKTWVVGILQEESNLVCEVICEAYESAAHPICILIVSQLVATKLLTVDEDTSDTILSCIEKYPDFGKDLAKEASQAAVRHEPKHSYQKQYQCPDCEAQFRTYMIPDAYAYSCPDCEKRYAAEECDDYVIED